MTSSTFLTAAVLVVTALAGVLAQGDAAAAVGGQKNNPTKEWTQWQEKSTYNLEDLPIQYMGANRIPGGGEAQSGWNQCANNTWNQKSLCQTAWINSLDDWCVWGPPEGGDIATTERVAVAYCTKKHGTRIIPDGTIKGAHFLQTPSYVQISGVGDFTSIGLPQGDEGGEMDYAGADDLGNPIGGVIFTTAMPGTNGKPTQIKYWTNFMSWNQFCLRGCWGDNGAANCEHRLDTMGCNFNMPSYTGYDPDVFESCQGDDAPFVGVYGASTFHQGDAITPEAHDPASSSKCVTATSISNGLLTAPKKDVVPAGSNSNGTQPAPTNPANHQNKAAPTISPNHNNSNSGSSSSSSDALPAVLPIATVMFCTALAFIGVLVL